MLLRWRGELRAIAAEVAPGSRYLGVMLPYTPLHHLLLRDAGRPAGDDQRQPVEEPIAQGQRRGAAPAGRPGRLLPVHNRDIYARYDDSVWLVPGLVGDAAEPGRRSPCAGRAAMRPSRSACPSSCRRSWPPARS